MRCTGLLLLTAAGCCSALRVTNLPLLQASALRPSSSAGLLRSGGCPQMAKKGGKKGKKGGGGKKGKSGFAWASSFQLKPFESSSLRQLTESAVSAYATRTGSSLHPTLVDASDVPKALWLAPVACVIVGVKPASETGPESQGGEAAEGPESQGGEAAEGSSDADAEAEAAPPQILYANLAALEAHGLGADDYEQLIGSATRLPATMAKKLESDYGKKLETVQGARFSMSGPRWAIEKMSIVDGALSLQSIGTTYAWSEWELDDGTTCEAGGIRRARALTAEEVEAAVTAQALEVRRLKEEEGLGNQDPAVMEAVVELKRLKALAVE